VLVQKLPCFLLNDLNGFWVIKLFTYLRVVEISMIERVGVVIRRAGVPRNSTACAAGVKLLLQVAMLLAGFVFLHFAGTIRSVLGTAETTVRGSAAGADVVHVSKQLGHADPAMS
jgi:hypothetical protein